uniref:Uncharacterized protein n=1 Tax=Siphoviridae sp. ctxMM9 TaxID=2827973 RepID=A0A8S5T683_9CAUD|nr:MAG TPA: hypothetical protein [Siphoviridae sp. ctxMM9]
MLYILTYFSIYLFSFLLIYLIFIKIIIYKNVQSFRR